MTKSYKLFALFLPLTMFFCSVILSVVEVAFGHLKFSDVIIAIISAAIGCAFGWGAMVFLSNFSYFNKVQKPKKAKSLSLFILAQTLVFTLFMYVSVTWIAERDLKAEIWPCVISGIFLTPWFYYWGKKLQKLNNTLAVTD